VTACKNLYATTCNGVIVNNTQNTLTLVGNNNEINYALDSGDAINNINIGSTVPSDFNVINLTQTGAGEHMATITIDGNNNLVDLVQN
jgi:ABC-type hemin transport system substrate-binding protein